MTTGTSITNKLQRPKKFDVVVLNFNPMCNTTNNQLFRTPLFFFMPRKTNFSIFMHDQFFVSCHEKPTFPFSCMINQRFFFHSVQQKQSLYATPSHKQTNISLSAHNSHYHFISTFCNEINAGVSFFYIIIYFIFFK